MNMSIIAASRLRAQKIIPNTFLGGSFTQLQCAVKLGVLQSEIKGHQIVNNQTAFRIDVDYSFIDSAFRNENILYYIDLEGKCIGANGIDTFLGNSLSIIYLPKILNLANFSIRSRLNLLAIPEIDFIGDSPLSNGVFNQKVDEIIVNKTQENINSGSPDGDLIDAISLGSNIIYKDLTDPNQTTPPTAPIISTNTIGGTYVELNVSQPTHVNNLKYALVFANGFFQNIIDINNVYAINLQEQTSYDIKVIIADEYFNISPYSNTINVTTTTTPALFQNAVAYYKLDETSGNAIDVVNGYNGTLNGGVTQGVAGKIGTAYSFDGVDGYIDVNESFDFIQNTLVFTINLWVKINDLNQRAVFLGTNGATSSKGFYIVFENGVGAGNQSIRFVAVKGVSGEPVISKISNDNAINDNNYHLISIVGVGNDVKIYVDNIETSYNTTSQFATAFSGLSIGATANPMYIGGLHGLGNLSSPFNGIIDEVNINDTDFTTGEINDLYNNGNGTTI